MAWQSNSISDLKSLSGLIELRKLWLGGNQISELWPLSELILLRMLSLGGNQISNLDPLSKLLELRKLWLGGNQISKLGALANFLKLNELLLGGNQISDLSPLSELKQLQKLSLEGNRITDLKPLSGLAQLKELSLGVNQISNLEPLSGLMRLKELSLSGNRIRDIGPLSGLVQLRELSLGVNQISDIRPLSELKQLQKLSLGVNQIKELDPLSGLTHLIRLSLIKNPIKNLPVWITDFSMGIQWEDSYFGVDGYVTFYDNPLESPPPEIVKEGKETIRSYFKQLGEQNKDYLFEAKLLVVGEPEAGKTSMVWKLENPECLLPRGDDTTRGIDVRQFYFMIHEEDFAQLAYEGKVTKRRFRVNVWDFGGQEIYKATHRFFLTNRSLYALVADNRKEDTDFNYWLHIVEMFGGDSPLLIVQNEKQQRKRELDITAMTRRFNNLHKDVLHVNFADRDKTRLFNLKREIRQQIIKLAHIGSPVPAKWTLVRDILEHDKRHFISLEVYLELCCEYGIKDKKDALVLSQYFHDIGVFLHFQDEVLLRKTIFLDSNWATKAVYKILDHPLLDEQQGRFTLTDAESIWHEEEYEFLCDELLRLMNKFFLAYKVIDKDEYIVPDKLPSKKSEYSWDENDNLCLKYDYDLFMPKGIMSQFIVEMHRFITDHDRVWKRGCVLQRETAIAEVIESYDARNIQIRISGKNKRDFMTIIVDQLDRISGQYEKMKVEKLIPCNCDECKGTKNPYLYKHSDLKRRIEKGRREVECGKSYEMVNVQQLIDDVLNEKMPGKERSDGKRGKKNKIFVSYSHKDKVFLDSLKTHIEVMNYEGLSVDMWDDNQISYGDLWKEEIRKALDSAGIAIILLSTKFLASKFIREYELPELLQAAKKEGTVILPLIISPCRFEESPLSVFQAVNNPQNPLSELSENEREREYLKLMDRIEGLVGN